MVYDDCFDEGAWWHNPTAVVVKSDSCDDSGRREMNRGKLSVTKL